MADNKDNYPKGSRQNPNVVGGSSQGGLQSAKTRPGQQPQSGDSSDSASSAD